MFLRLIQYNPDFNSDNFRFSLWLKATCSLTCCSVPAGSFDSSQKWAICRNERSISSAYFQKLSKPLFTAVYSALVAFGWGKPQQWDWEGKKMLTAGLFFCWKMWLLFLAKPFWIGRFPFLKRDSKVLHYTKGSRLALMNKPCTIAANISKLLSLVLLKVLIYLTQTIHVGQTKYSWMTNKPTNLQPYIIMLWCDG